MIAYLEVSQFGTIPVVTFYNTSTKTNECWVCENAEVARERAAELESKPHITNVSLIDATVKGRGY